MKLRLFLALGTVTLLVACGPRDEFPHETIEAYQADSDMRQGLLDKCAAHLTGKVPFATESDTDECRKAVTADQNVRLIQHEAREQAASKAAISEAVRQFEGK